MSSVKSYGSEGEDEESSEDEQAATGWKSRPAWLGLAVALLLIAVIVTIPLVYSNHRGIPDAFGLHLGGRSPVPELIVNCSMETDNLTAHRECHEERRRRLQLLIRDLPPEVRDHFGEFAKFLLQHGRGYFTNRKIDVAEFRRRLRQFASTVQLAAQRNAEAERGNRSSRARHGITKFADWTPEEFQALLGGRHSVDPSARRLRWPFESIINDLNDLPGEPKSAPCTTNWASRSTVRNQGACGDCWAFSAVEAIRAAAIQQNGRDPGLLSTQYLVNCVEDYQGATCKGGAGGCCGGNPMTAFQFIKDNGGIPTQEDYGNVFTSLQDAGVSSGSSSAGPTSPTGKGFTYSGNFPRREWPCKPGVANTVSLSSGWPQRLRSEEEMGNYVCETGSLSVLVDASQWQTYAGGVIDALSCGSDVDHAVVAIGLSEEHNAWIIQNSWGQDWGVSVDGTPAPVDKYSNCEQLAGVMKVGCRQSLTTGETVKEACAVSCGDQQIPGGYIYVQYGADACAITTQADVVPKVVEL